MKAINLLSQLKVYGIANKTYREIEIVLCAEELPFNTVLETNEWIKSLSPERLENLKSNIEYLNEFIKVIDNAIEKKQTKIDINQFEQKIKTENLFKINIKEIQQDLTRYEVCILFKCNPMMVTNLITRNFLLETPDKLIDKDSIVEYISNVRKLGNKPNNITNNKIKGKTRGRKTIDVSKVNLNLINKDFSQEELTKLFGCSLSTVSRLVTGIGSTGIKTTPILKKKLNSKLITKDSIIEFIKNKQTV